LNHPYRLLDFENSILDDSQFNWLSKPPELAGRLLITRFITGSKLNNQPTLVIITRVAQALGAHGASYLNFQRTAASSF